jgi:hypothetical protein
MSSEQAGPVDQKYLLAAWEKHEKIAMHFNDLILKLRIQALGALAAVVTVGGVLLKSFVPAGAHPPWGVVTSVLAVLLAFWIAIWLLDFLYYNRLLMGAVESLLGVENAINSGAKIDFNMSHKIEDAVLGKPPTLRQKGSIKGPTLFYSIVTVVLFAGTSYSGAMLLCCLCGCASCR